MPKPEKSLYFIALVPSEPLASKILDIKQEFADKYNSSAALRSPPHITLHMPFKWREEKETRLIDVLTQISAHHEKFKLELADFGCFEPRVIYINIKNSEALYSLQAAVMKRAAADWHIYQQGNSRPFKPHMTVAFRDLRKPQFQFAWDEFKNRKFKDTMIVNSLVLLKHNGKVWNISSRIPF